MAALTLTLSIRFTEISSTKPVVAIEDKLNISML